jgi:NADPH:quinone reductase-like Zn-dependent oxidoreductase
MAIRLSDLSVLDVKDKMCIVLAEIGHPLLPGIDQGTFEAVRNLVLQSAGVLWLSKGGAMDSPTPEANWFVGLSRSIRAEHAGVTLATLDLESSKSIIAEDTVDAILRLFVSICTQAAGKQQDCKYLLRDGVICTCRIIAQKEANEMLADQYQTPSPVLLPFKQPNRPLKLEIGVPGMLNTLQFVDDLDGTNPLAADQIEIKVVASALNFVDIMIAMGQVPDTMLGAECSGIVTRIGENITNFKVGDRAMTWGLGYHATNARNPGIMFQSVPDDTTFEEAASIPVVYCTSYYAFFDAARLQKGETVLIHSAAGGVGQSAIILAQFIGAEIFATVGSEEKKQLIMSQYGIPDDHIFDSRNLSFGKGIKRMIKGRGVDVVLNSLAGDGLRESWLCLAPYGRFVEIGKKDIVGNTGLEMSPFMHNRTFASVNILGMYRDNVRLASRIFADVMDLVRQGVARGVKPMTIYDYSQIETAFRMMQAGKNVGKIVLWPNEQDVVPVSLIECDENDLANNV